MEAKIIANSQGAYDRVQIQFSEPIKDSTVNSGNFVINYRIGTDAGTTAAIEFSTERSDGTVDVDENDEYITILFNAKVSIDSVVYKKGSLTDLAGNPLEDVTIVPEE